MFLVSIVLDQFCDKNMFVFKDLMRIEMVLNDLKFYLIYQCRCNTEKKLRREIKRWWNANMHDIAYCNFKFNNLYKVVDKVISFSGRATGLETHEIVLFIIDNKKRLLCFF